MPVSSRVSRSESLRSEFSDQSKRVSFHRSVDVKRIPKISEQSANRHLNSSSPLLPVNDKELLLREARNVVKSIDRVQCSVGGEIPGGKQRQVNSGVVNSSRRENSFQRSSGGGSRGGSVDRILNSRNSKSYSPAPSSTTTITNGYHNNYHTSAPPPTKIKAGGTTERKLREGSASREIKSQPPSGSTSSNLNSITKTTNNNKSQSSKADKEENCSSSKTVINRVSGTLKRVKSAVNKKKVPPPPKETLKHTAAIRNPNLPPPPPKLVITKEKLQTRESSSTSPSPVIIKTTREKVPSRVVREVNPPPEKVVEMTKNPRVSSIVDKLSNMKTSPPPFHYDSQPFSYISGRPKLSSPKEVIYAQVVVGDKDKRTIHRSVKGGGYNNNNNTRGSYDAVDGGYEHSANKMNGSFHHEYGGGGKNGGYASGDVISSSNDGDYYLDEYLKNAKPRANVTTVLLNNVDDEDFTVEKPHFRFRSVSPKNYSEDFSYNNNTTTTTNYNNNSNGFSYGSLGRYNNNSTTSSTRYQQQQQQQQHNYRHRNNENDENTEFISRTMNFGDDDFGYHHDTSNNKKVDEISNTGYYPHETKETYFGDFYNYKHQQENEKDVLFGNRREEDEDFKLDAQIDKWRGRSRKETAYEEKYDKYDDYYHNARENDDDDDEEDNKFLKKYSTHQFPPQQHGKYESSSYETMDNKSKTEKYDRSSYDASQQSGVTTTENGKKSGAKSEKEITSTKLVKEIEKTRENSLPSAKMVNNVNVKKSNKGLFSTLTRKEKFPFFTLKKKKTVVDNKDVEDVEPTRDGEYHNWSSADDLYRDETTKGSGDYRRNLAMRSSTMIRPVKSKEEELRSKSLDRRFKATPTIVITPNTPAIDESNKPPVFRSRENNLRYFGDTDCEDTKISAPPTWPGVNNSSESENGSRMSGSQRSVYLHAAAVADIPPSGLQRRTLSRDELSNHSGHQKQTRHLARSMSVLAPWRPRHYREKYEMHYSNGGPGGRLPPKPPRSPTRKSPHRATSSDSLLKIDEEREIISSSSNSKNKKSAAAVSRSKSMPKDSRLASWLRRKYKR